MPKVNGSEIHKNRVWIYFSNWAKIIVLHNAWQVQIDIRMMANSTDGEHSLHPTIAIQTFVLYQLIVFVLRAASCISVSFTTIYTFHDF